MTFRKALIPVAATALLTVAACTSTPTQQSTGQIVDSSVVATKVRTAIADDQLSILPIDVGVYKDVVQLSGFVTSDAQMRHAEYVASNVNGVRGVYNDLVIKSEVAMETEESAGEIVDSTVTNTRVRTAIAADGDLSIIPINVDTYKGVVQLSGFVKTVEQKRRAEEIALNTNGVRAVYNDLLIRTAIR